MQSKPTKDGKKPIARNAWSISDSKRAGGLKVAWGHGFSTNTADRYNTSQMLFSAKEIC